MPLNQLRRRPQTTKFIKKWFTLILIIAWSMAGQIGIGQTKTPSNRLTIQNNSGQFALVKTVGPTRAVAKMPLDQKKTIHVAPGEYYILVRFGFAPKEYIYTKGETFTIMQEKDKFSITTVTLHRIVSGMKNPHEVSREEFENYKISQGTKNKETEKKPEDKE